MRNQTLEIILCLITALNHFDLFMVIGTMQVMNLSYAANKVDQSIKLFYLKALNYSLRSILQRFFKFNGFKLKVSS